MKVLIGCEFSGVVRRAFRDKGHDAYSCDLLPAEDQSPYHLQCDVMDILREHWSLAIFHPPCTFLCNSGARWWRGRQMEQRHALAFVELLLSAPIPRIALENPEGCISTRIRKPSQVIHPWEYGHGEQKKTCLWLKNLPLLQPTRLVAGREQRVWKMGESKSRSRERARTYTGVASAMAQQWGAGPDF